MSEVRALGDGWYLVRDVERQTRVAIASDANVTWVYVDGVRVEELGTRINESQTITLDKRAEKISRVTILLHNVRDLVREQVLALGAFRIVLVLVEMNVMTDGIGTCTDSFVGFDGLRTRVDTQGTQIGSKRLLKFAM